MDFHELCTPTKARADMTLDEMEVIEFIRDPSTPENDLCGWIDCAGTLLLVEAVPDLVNVIASERLSLHTRKHAAATIQLLGSSYATKEISMLRAKSTPLLNDLFDLAEGI